MKQEKVHPELPWGCWNTEDIYTHFQREIHQSMNPSSHNKAEVREHKGRCGLFFLYNYVARISMAWDGVHDEIYSESIVHIWTTVTCLLLQAFVSWGVCFYRRWWSYHFILCVNIICAFLYTCTSTSLYVLKLQGSNRSDHASEVAWVVSGCTDNMGYPTMNRIGGEAAAASLYAPVLQNYSAFTHLARFGTTCWRQGTLTCLGSEMNHDLAYVDAKHMNTCLCREMLK